MEFPKKVAQVKAEHILEHAKANGNVRWLKKTAKAIEAEEPNNMKAFAKLRKAYLGEFMPEMLEKKKSPKKGKNLFQRIAELED